MLWRGMLGEWEPLLEPVLHAPWRQALQDRVEAAYEAGEPEVYPPKEQLFSALRLTAPTQVKCVILGQDPYHQPGQAHGLAFSVSRGQQIPPSLRNIYRELQEDLSCTIPNHGCLEEWGEQGVLLLNNVLTVYRGAPNSHKTWGWQKFTMAVLEQVNQLPQPVAYLLWGKEAQGKAAELEHCGTPRLILIASHPSPLSAYRGFLGSRPFSQVNRFLNQQGSREISWEICKE